MEYRQLPCGEQVSTIGIGSGYLRESSGDEIEIIIDLAVDRGITLLDTVMNDDIAIQPVAHALKDRRNKMVMQFHFGISYQQGVYERTSEPEKVRFAFKKLLRRFGTDYAGIGLIHCIDDESDLDRVLNGGTLHYALRLKQEGNSWIWKVF